jgi:hypothetical protein
VSGEPSVYVVTGFQNTVAVAVPEGDAVVDWELAPPPHPAVTMISSDMKRIENTFFTDIGYSPLSCGYKKPPDILSGGSADIGSVNALVPLLCVPGFPLVCSEQRKMKKFDFQMRYHRGRYSFCIGVRIAEIPGIVCDSGYKNTSQILSHPNANDRYFMRVF